MVVRQPLAAPPTPPALSPSSRASHLTPPHRTSPHRTSRHTPVPHCTLELLMGIRIVKYYGWENAFKGFVKTLRAKGQ